MRGRSGAALATLSALTVAACGPPSTSAPADRSTAPVPSRTGGQATADSSQPSDAGRYGPFAVTGATGSQVVTLDGRPVLTAASVEAEGLLVNRVVQAGAHDLALIEVDGPTACPVRYVVVDVAPSRKVRASAPFGTCAAVSRADLDGAKLRVDVQAWRGGGAPTPAARYVYAAGGVTAMKAAPPPSPAPPADAEDGPPSTRPSLKWIGPQGCLAYAGPTPPDPGSQVEADALAQDFEATYPKDLADPRRVEHAELTPDRLDRLVRCLAALSSWPGSDGFVPDEAAALFASRRYGAPALAALDHLAATPSEREDLRTAARSFSAQMRGIAGRRTEPSR